MGLKRNLVVRGSSSHPAHESFRPPVARPFALALFVNPFDRAADLLDRAVGDDQLQLRDPVKATLQDLVDERFDDRLDAAQLRLIRR